MSKLVESSYLSEQKIKKSLSLNFNDGLNLVEKNLIKHLKYELEKSNESKRLCILDSIDVILENYAEESDTDIDNAYDSNPFSSCEDDSDRDEDRDEDDPETTFASTKLKKISFGISNSKEYCELCICLFKSKSIKTNHVLLFHTECEEDDYQPDKLNNYFNCNKCEVKVRDKKSLVLHRIKAHRLKTKSNFVYDSKIHQKCDICKEYFSKTNMARHQKSCELYRQNYLENLEEIKRNEFDSNLNREQRFELINSLNISEFFNFNLSNIFSNDLGSITLDVSLFYMFLCLLGLRPSAFLFIKRIHIQFIEDDFLNLNFKCKFGVIIKQKFKINNFKIIQKLKSKLEILNDNDFFFLNSLKEPEEKIQAITSYGSSFDSKYRNPRIFRSLRACIEYQTTLELIASILKATPSKKADLIRNLNLSKHASLNGVKNLLCHEQTSSTLYYIDDRLFYRFLRENLGEVFAIKIYKKSYKIVNERKSTKKDVSIDWAFHEPANLYEFKELKEILTFSTETVNEKDCFINKLFK